MSNDFYTQESMYDFGLTSRPKKPWRLKPPIASKSAFIALFKTTLYTRDLLSLKEENDIVHIFTLCLLDREECNT